MKHSMLQAGILGLCILQGFLGFTTVGYADTTIITVKQDDSADCSTINEALDVVKGWGQLTDHVIIKVLDAGPYNEGVYITNIPTSRDATLTLEGVPGGTTISANYEFLYPNGTPQPLRPIHVGSTDYVTIRNFIFQNKNPATSGSLTAINFAGHQSPSDSVIEFDSCIWDGQSNTFKNGAILMLWMPNCNIYVHDSIFKNVAIDSGYPNLALVCLDERSSHENPVNLGYTPTFTFFHNTVTNNDQPLIQIEGNTNGYYHNIVIQDNTFENNNYPTALVAILNQKKGIDVSGNYFLNNTTINNTHFKSSLALKNSGSAWVAGNEFTQNGGAAEVYVQGSISGTTTLTGNTIAASEGSSYFGVWVALSGKAKLQSYDNTFYSNYNTKDQWNTPRTDCVAAWDTGNVKALTLSQWNDKTPKDGVDYFGALPVP
jgi:hypothetical protein